MRQSPIVPTVWLAAGSVLLAGVGLFLHFDRFGYGPSEPFLASRLGQLSQFPRNAEPFEWCILTGSLLVVLGAWGAWRQAPGLISVGRWSSLVAASSSAALLVSFAAATLLWGSASGGPFDRRAATVAFALLLLTGVLFRSSFAARGLIAPPPNPGMQRTRYARP